MKYRRASTVGKTYFFAVNLAERDADTLVRHIDDLLKVMTKVRAAHPFASVAMVVLPEHLHALCRLPAGDSDYPMRVAAQGGILTVCGKRRTFPPKPKGKTRAGYLAAAVRVDAWEMARSLP
jgi:REP element-mobilizing transposase RayT